MKLRYLTLFLLSILLYSCSNDAYSPDFIEKVSGRYFFNSDEIISIYFKDNTLYMEWKGAKDIKPLKIDENTFFVKEMNEKIQFLTNPSDQQDYIVLVPKEKGKTISYDYRKLHNEEKAPHEYLIDNEFDKAVAAYLAIKEKDSLDIAINERKFNSLGYKELRAANIDKAIQIFKINVALYPESSNVYDSLGEAYIKNGDTAKAILNYKTALKLNPNNKRAKRTIKKLETSNK